MNPTRKLSVALLGAALVGLTACGGGAGAAPAPTQESTIEIPALGPQETYVQVGPATETAYVGNDIALRVAAVEVIDPNQLSRRSPDLQVNVTVEITNDGPEVLALAQSGYVKTSLQHGVNRYDGKLYAGPEDSSSLPAQLVPGSSATYTTPFLVPAEGLESLTLTVNPNRDLMPDHTFEGVETLLAG